MLESGGRGRIRQVISRNVDSLDRGNGSFLRGANSILHGTDLPLQSRLVTDSGRNTSEQRTDFGTGLRESENVVNKKQNILSVDIPEVFGLGETSQSDTHSHTSRFVHLSEDKSALGFSSVVNLNDSGVTHFVVEVISLTGSFSNTGEHGVTTVTHGDVVDQFHNQDGLSDTSTSEESNLSSLLVRGNQVNDFNSDGKNFFLGNTVFEQRRVSVNGPPRSSNRTTLVIRVTKDVHDTAQHTISDGNSDGSFEPGDFHTREQVFGVLRVMHRARPSPSQAATSMTTR